ncbi:glycine-rich domain-containing protein, partial [uncultured Algibacter sp.]|uniref:glycine-rich domain-containing protein n=1 Tax=uncultured Algibacter sp. TaxID=298659 RepID=UPI003217D6D1
MLRFLCINSSKVITALGKGTLKLKQNKKGHSVSSGNLPVLSNNHISYTYANRSRFYASLESKNTHSLMEKIIQILLLFNKEIFSSSIKRSYLFTLLLGFLMFFSGYGQTISSTQLSATGNPLNNTGGDGTVVRITNITDGQGSDNNGAGYRTGTATATTDRTYTISFLDAGGAAVLMNSVELDLGFFNNDVDNPNPGNGGLEGINNISVNNGTASIAYSNTGGEAPIAAFYTDYFPIISNPNNGNWTGVTVPAGTIYAPNGGSFDAVANGTAVITSTSAFSSITFTHDYLSPSGNPFGIVITELRYSVQPITSVINIVDNNINANPVTSVKGFCDEGDFTYSVYWESTTVTDVELVDANTNVILATSAASASPFTVTQATTAVGTRDVFLRNTSNASEVSPTITVNLLNCSPYRNVIARANGSYTIPAGIFSVTASVVGGGGGGGGKSSPSTTNKSGGGGGGSARITIPVVPGDVLSYTIGAGGPRGRGTSAGVRNGGPGGATVMRLNGSEILRGNGGRGTRNGGNNPGLGGTASGIAGRLIGNGSTAPGRPNANGGLAGIYRLNPTIVNNDVGRGGRGRNQNSVGPGVNGQNGGVSIVLPPFLGPDVTINQQGQDPTAGSNTGGVYRVVFSIPIDPTTFTIQDINLTGTANASVVSVTEIAPNDGTTFDVAIIGSSITGNAIATIPESSVCTLFGVNNTASTSRDNIILFDFTDTDGDGVFDSADLDDDNDGILDEDEDLCNSDITSYHNNWSYKTWLTAGATTNADNATFTFANAGLVANGDGTFTFSGRTDLNANFDTLEDASGVFSNDILAPADPNSTNASVIDLDNGIPANTNGEGEVIEITGYAYFAPFSNVSVTITDDTSDERLAYAVLNMSGAVLDSGNLGYDTNPRSIPLNFIAPNDGLVEIKIWIYDPSQFYSLPQILGVFVNSSKICLVDTDRDGIVNSLDLDSDGDGCPDAIEGVNTPTAIVLGDLTTTSGTLMGGNTGTGYIGTSTDPVLDNLGNDVDTNVANATTTLGVPTIVNTGQTLGSSQNGAIENCTDTDGDGVPDSADLDDDNDGILDTDECMSIAPIGSVDFTGLTNAGATFQMSDTGADLVDTEVSAVSISGGTPDSTIDNLAFGPESVFRITNNSPEVGDQELVTFTFESPTEIIITAGPDFAGINGAETLTFVALGTSAGFTWVQDAVGTTVIGTISTTNVPNDTFTVTSSLPTDTSTSYAYSTSGSASSMQVTRTIVSATAFANDVGFQVDVTGSCDLDGDGIPNSLDLDSDGDGCPDALEGVNTPTAIVLGDLTTASGTLMGGNSGLGYTGSSTTPVLDNLGNTVDTNIANATTTLGVPTIVNTGQAIGASQNGADATACIPPVDTDGDGVFDDADLDDDNDGVLDILECANPLEIQIVIPDNFQNAATNMTSEFTNNSPALSNVTLETNTSVLQNPTFYDNQDIIVAAATGAGISAADLAGIVTEINSTDANSPSTYVILLDFFTVANRARGIDFLNNLRGTSYTLGAGYLTFQPNLNSAATYAAEFTGLNPYTVAVGNGITGVANQDILYFVNNTGSTDAQSLMFEINGKRVFFATDFSSFQNFNNGAITGTAYANNENKFGPVLAGMTSLATCSDTDGDGIANNLDLDSDGDGCPDAIEGVNTPTAIALTDLTTAGGTLMGGNSGPGYTGTSTDAVLDNLGNTVGSTVGVDEGVPTIVGTGQAIGASQNGADATACIPPVDTDGDGIFDDADLDDDNDGILDTVEDAECLTNAGSLDLDLQFNNLVANSQTTQTLRAAAWQADITDAGTQVGRLYFTALRNGTANLFANNYTAGGWPAPAVRIENSSSSATISADFGTGTNNIVVGGVNVGGVSFAQYTATIENTTTQPQEYTLSYVSNASEVPGVNLGINHNSAPGTLEAIFDDSKVTATVTDYNTPNLFDPITSLHTAGFTGGAETVSVMSNTPFTITNGASGIIGTGGNTANSVGYSINYTVTLAPGESTDIVAIDRGAINVDNYGFLVSRFVPCVADTDGDGIANSLDLDSDGDGCPDALEGVNTPTAIVLGDLTTASGTLMGGNSGAGYTGSSSTPILDNLGNTVGSTAGVDEGVPTIVGTGQAIGASQNGADATACIPPVDTDGDGVPDSADLDDDNDGILDDVECEVVNLLANFDFQDNGTDWIIDGGHSFANDGGDINLYYFDDVPPGGLPNDAVVRNANIISITNGQSYDLSFFMAYSSANPRALNTQFLLYNTTTTTQVQLVGPQLTTGGSGASGIQLPITAGAGSNFETAAVQISESFIATVPTGDYYLAFSINRPVAGTGRDIHIDDVILSTTLCSRDTDNDGLIDSLDLDSDGDGCPDALEGVNTPTAIVDTDLVDATGVGTLMGGNSGTDYTGPSTDMVLDNLGNTVGSIAGVDEGVPTIVALGQGIGASRDGLDTVACVVDDMDNVDSSIEDGAPNGDGNGDGTPDSEQPNVASIPDGSGAGSYVTIEVSGLCNQITRMVIEQEADQTSIDSLFDYPLGLVDFTLQCGAPGETAVVKYYWYGLTALEEIDAYRKFGPTIFGASVFDYTSSIVGRTEAIEIVNGQSVYTTTYILTDNALGDESTVGAEIVDPTGPATSTDADGDGIGNEVDLDDDNDGILDTVECPATLIESVSFAGITNAGGIFSVSDAGSDLIDTTVDAFTISGGTPDSVISEFVFGSDSTIELLNNSPEVGDVESSILTFQAETNVNVSSSPDFSGLSSRETFTVVAIGPSSGFTWDEVSLGVGTVGTISTTNVPNDTFTVTGSVPTSANADYQYNSIGTATGLLVTRTMVLASATADNFRFQVDVQNGCDVDGDGLLDFRDTDSDNDGCADAIEAAGGFDATNIDATTLALTGPVGTATSANPGVPTQAGAGQGTTADVITFGPDADADGIADACDPTDDRPDYDNDGVPDAVDLDDDNDGILDSVECPTGKTLSDGTFVRVVAQEGFENSAIVGATATSENPDNNHLSNFAFSAPFFVNRSPDFVSDTAGSPWYKIIEGTSFGVLQATNNDSQSTTANDGLGIRQTAVQMAALGFLSGDQIYFEFSYSQGKNYDTDPSGGRPSDADSSIAIWFGNGAFAFGDGTVANDNVIPGAWAPTGTISDNTATPRDVMANGTWQRYTSSFAYTGGDIYIAFVSQTGAIISNENIFIDDIILATTRLSENDIDDDGIPNCFDLDSDNDGIYDVVETGGTDLDNDGDADDTDGDGTNNNGIPNTAGTGVTIPTDSGPTPGTPDYVDTDSDEDGCSDANEAFADANADGGDGDQFGTGDPLTVTEGEVNANGTVTTADYTTGTNADVTTVGPNADLASENAITPIVLVSDTCDEDDDNDGNPDITDPNPLTPTASDDTIVGMQMAGTPVSFDILANDDFIPSATTLISDTTAGNGQGVVSFDPITGDVTYTPSPLDNGLITIVYQVCNDVDGNGISNPPADVCATATISLTVDGVDTDNDGLPDAVDLDDDNDGILDTTEGCVTGVVDFEPRSVAPSTGPLGVEVTTAGGGIFPQAAFRFNRGFDWFDNSAYAIQTTGPLDATQFRLNVDATPGVESEAGSISFSGNNVIGAYLHINSLDQSRLLFDTAANAGINVSVLSGNDFNQVVNGTIISWGATIINPTNLATDVTVPQEQEDVANGRSADFTLFFSRTDGGPITNLAFVLEEVNDGAGNSLADAAATNNDEGHYALELIVASDTDGDGVADCNDLDSDNDGIYDVVETGGTDADNDGEADDTDGDGANNSGIPNTAGTGITVPTDSGPTPGTPDYLDTDSDEDGCSDANEAFADANADGSDGEQFGAGDPLTVTEGEVNANGTVTTADYTTGTNTDVTTVGPDLDIDTIANACDEDDDNDGNPDTTDPNPTVPTADDDSATATAGIPEVIDVLGNDDFLTTTDPNNLGTTTITDTGNGTAAGMVSIDPSTGEITYTPLPSEGNTTVTIEYQVCNDVNGNTTQDPTNPTTPTDQCDIATVRIVVAEGDQDGDGVLDGADVCPGGDDALDADGDTVPDFCDLDDDNDGIADAVECPTNFIAIRPQADLGIAPSTLGNTITNVDISTRLGLPTGSVLISGTGLNRPDTNPNLFVGDDFSGTPATFTISGTAASRIRARLEHGGVIETGNTIDTLESLDGTIYNFTTTLNASFADVSVPPVYQIVNLTGTNANNGGARFTWESSSAGVTNFSFSSNDLGDDSAIFLSLSVDPDFDGDGLANCVDLDADNDGIYDVAEAGGTDVDNDGIADGIDGDSNGIPDSAGTGITPADSGATVGTPDYLDTDADEDGCTDTNEYYDDATADGGDGGQFGADPAAINANGTVIGASYPATGADTDANSTADYIEGAIGAPLPDLDGDASANACDLDDDGDGNPDTTDPNPLAPMVTDDTNTGDPAVAVVTNVLTNDDYLPNNDPGVLGTTTLTQLTGDPANT